MEAFLAQARAILLTSQINEDIHLWKAPRPGSGSLPAIVLSLVSTTPVRTLTGEVSNEARISVVIITSLYSECVELANKIKGVLNDYRGSPVEGLSSVRFWIVGTSHEIRGRGGEEEMNDNESFAILQDYRVKNTP